MTSLILKRRSSDINKLLFHNPLLRSSATAAASAAPPSDRLLPGAPRLPDISQTRGLSGLGFIKTNPITNNTYQLWNDAKQLHTTTTMPAGLGAAAAMSVGGGVAIRRYRHHFKFPSFNPLKKLRTKYSSDKEHLDSKDLVNGSECFGDSIFQESHIHISEGRNVVFCDASVDADSSNVLTKLLQCLEVWSGKVNQVENIAFETLISRCINQDGRGAMSWTLILSKEPADVRGSTFNQPLEKVQLTEHTTILQVPYANPYTVTEEIAKEIAEKFCLHYNEGIRVVYLLGQRFCVTVINAEKETNSLGTELLGEVIWENQHQLKLAEFVGGHFKLKEDLANGSDKGHISSSSCEGDKHLTRVGMDCSGEERVTASKTEGAKKHIQDGIEFGGHGGASTSSSGRANEITQSGDALKSGMQKQVVAKKKKY